MVAIEHDGPLTERLPGVRTRVVGKGGTPIDGVALQGSPGTCAGCRRPFSGHSDPELRACAASLEPTQPEAQR